MHFDSLMNFQMLWIVHNMFGKNLIPDFLSSKLKALQHELACSRAALKAKTSELEVRRI